MDNRSYSLACERMLECNKHNWTDTKGPQYARQAPFTCHTEHIQIDLHVAVTQLVWFTPKILVPSSLSNMAANEPIQTGWRERKEHRGTKPNKAGYYTSTTPHLPGLLSLSLSLLMVSWIILYIWISQVHDHTFTCQKCMQIFVRLSVRRHFYFVFPKRNRWFGRLQSYIKGYIFDMVSNWK